MGTNLELLVCLLILPKHYQEAFNVFLGISIETHEPELTNKPKYEPTYRKNKTETSGGTQI